MLSISITSLSCRWLLIDNLIIFFFRICQATEVGLAANYNCLFLLVGWEVHLCSICIPFWLPYCLLVVGSIALKFACIILLYTSSLICFFIAFANFHLDFNSWNNIFSYPALDIFIFSFSSVLLQLSIPLSFLPCLHSGDAVYPDKDLVCSHRTVWVLSQSDASSSQSF